MKLEQIKKVASEAYQRFQALKKEREAFEQEFRESINFDAERGLGLRCDTVQISSNATMRDLLEALAVSAIPPQAQLDSEEWYSLEFHWKEPETDEEVFQRLLEDHYRLAVVEQHEKELLARLKTKYGGD